MRTREEVPRGPAGAGRRSRRRRWSAAALLLVVAGVHLNLYAREGYDQVPTIGWLFLLAVVAGAVLALLIVFVDNPLVALAGAGYAVAALGAYLLALLLPEGIFLFKEPGVSYSGGVSIASEVAVAALLLLEAGRTLRGRRGGRRA